MSGRSTACPPAVFQYHLCLGDRFGSPRMGQTLETKLQDLCRRWTRIQQKLGDSFRRHFILILIIIIIIKILLHIHMYIYKKSHTYISYLIYCIIVIFIILNSYAFKVQKIRNK